MSGESEVFCGSDETGHALRPGNRSTASFGWIRAVCRDPLNPNGWWIADRSSIRYFDESKNDVSLFVSGPLYDRATERMNSLLFTADRKTMWIGCNDCIHRIDIATRSIYRACGQAVSCVVWARGPSIEPDSSLYCMTSTDGLSRFDTASPEMHPFQRWRGWQIHYSPLICTESGHILFSKAVAGGTLIAYAFDPRTSTLERLPYLDRGSREYWLLVDAARMIITTNTGVLTTYTLPPQFFHLPKCCDRDDL